MFFDFKSVVHFLEFVTYLLLSRSFGNIIHDIAEKYEHIELKMTEELWKYICFLILKVSFIFLNSLHICLYKHRYHFWQVDKYRNLMWDQIRHKYNITSEREVSKIISMEIKYVKYSIMIFAPFNCLLFQFCTFLYHFCKHNAWFFFLAVKLKIMPALGEILEPRPRLIVSDFNLLLIVSEGRGKRATKSVG